MDNSVEREYFHVLFSTLRQKVAGWSVILFAAAISTSWKEFIIFTEILDLLRVSHTKIYGILYTPLLQVELLSTTGCAYQVSIIDLIV